MTNKADIMQAVAVWHAGGLVAFPTETVYGLGADASNEEAVRRIFTAKNRPYNHPLIVHLARVEQLADWARDITPAVNTLAQAFWPGPLTLILKKQPHVLDIVTGGQETVGVRIPAHPTALSLLQAFGGGIVAPSANQFTHVSPTTAQAVGEELESRVDLIIDGGACSVGLESTILDMSSDQPRILRPGMISAAAIEQVLGVPVVTQSQEAAAIRVPGMHHLHYAPTTSTVMIASQKLADFVRALTPAQLPVAVITYHDISFSEGVECLRLSSLATEYAHDLYHTLRSVDHKQFKLIIIEAVPETTEWIAIRDRLSKATARG